MQRRQTLIIVKKNQRDEAEAALVAIFGNIALGTFSVSCDKGSQGYYVSSLSLTPGQLQEFQEAMASNIQGNKVSVGLHKGPAELKKQGLARKPHVARIAPGKGRVINKPVKPVDDKPDVVLPVADKSSPGNRGHK